MSPTKATNTVALIIGFVLFMVLALPVISDSNEGKFLTRDGSRAMTGNLNMGGNSINNLAGMIFDTVDVNGGTIDGTVIGGTSAAAGTFTTLTGTAFNASTLAVTTTTSAWLNAGTTTITGLLTASAGGSLTGTWTNLGAVSTVDINGGTWTGTVDGTPTAAGATWADLGIVSTIDVNAGTIDGATIGGASAGAGTFSTLMVDNTTLDANRISASTDFTVGTNASNDVLIGDDTTLIYVDGGLRFGVGGVGIGRSPADVDGTPFLIEPAAYTAPTNGSTYRTVIQGNTGPVTIPAGGTAVYAGTIKLREPNIISTGTTTNAMVIHIDSAPTEGVNNYYMLIEDKFVIQTNGNVGIGTLALPSSGDSGLVFNDGVPLSGMGADTAGIYADKVGTTTHMFAIDADGNTNQLSSHPSDVMAAASLACLMPPGAVNSSNYYIGKRVTVDWCAVLLALEALTGQTFMNFEDLPADQVRDWDTDQQARYDQREQERAIAKARRDELWERYQTLSATDTTGWSQAELDELRDERDDVLAERERVETPKKLKKTKPPKWMKDRGVSSSLP